MYMMGMNVKDDYLDFVCYRLWVEDFFSNICIVWIGLFIWIVYNIMVDKVLLKIIKYVEVLLLINIKDKIYMRLDKLYLNFDVFIVLKW